jgi:hypothetical protein
MASATTPEHVMPAFPSWLPLPPRYLVSDWIRLEKGRIIAARLRENPSLTKTVQEQLAAHSERNFPAHEEWRALLATDDVEKIASILESTDDEGQRLRSSMPFRGEPFITGDELEAIHARAFAG